MSDPVKSHPTAEYAWEGVERALSSTNAVEQAIAIVRANLRDRRICARSGHWAPQNDRCSCLRNQDQGLPGVMGWAEIAIAH